MSKRFGAIMAVILCLALIAAAQTTQKVVNFKKLQEFLPKIDLPDFTRGKPQGETTSAMGMSASNASVSYEKTEKDMAIEISVKIEDTAGVPFAEAGLSMMGMTEFENQTENGYEKSVKIQGFPGTEKMDNAEESKSAEIALVVGKRFMVTLSSSGTAEVALLRKLVDSMNLADLAKLTQ